jgi:hypothetical protein
VTITCQLESQVAHGFLCRLSEQHFQAAVFSVHLLIRKDDDENSVSEAPAARGRRRLFVDGLVRGAAARSGHWTARSNAAFVESWRSFENWRTMLRQLFEIRKNPACQTDASSFAQALATCEDRPRTQWQTRVAASAVNAA